MHVIMVQATILIIFISLSSIIATDSVYTAFNASNIVLDWDEDIDNYCAKRKCIRKCCQKDEYYLFIDEMSGKCMGFEGNFDFRNISVYDDNDYSRKINKNFSDIFLLVPGQFFEDIGENNSNMFLDVASVFSNDDGVLMHLSESGKLILEYPNSYKRWIFVNQFCVEYAINNNTSTLISDITPTFWFVIDTPNYPENNHFYVAALLVSSMFLLVVLIVYIILPDLRNLAGMVLMAYVFSLMAAYTLLACQLLLSFPSYLCIYMTAVLYFFFLATFCWMNVTSFDIWWTFRGYVHARPIHRRGEKFKFAMYCLYAWGVPLLMAVALVIINEADLSHMPWFIKPQIPNQACFLDGGQKLLYLYIPMLILIICNWMFFLMTAFNVWRLSRGTSVLDTAAAGSPAVHRKQKNRLMLYVKLSVIMGISWLLEVVAYFAPNSIIWHVPNVYNLLIGLSIFLIFVCKKKIFRKLRNRCDFTYIPSHIKSHANNCKSQTNLSQNDPLQISIRPEGLKGQTKNKEYYNNVNFRSYNEP